jgi:L-rhamnose-H+ transport protein
VTDLGKGFALVLLSSLCAGAFAVPSRLRTRYAVENMWALGYFVTTIVIPFGLAPLVLPEWPLAFYRAGAASVLLAVAFGAGWGIASTSFAAGVTTVGLSIGYAIIMGVNTAAGAVVPLARRWDIVSAEARIAVLIGIGLCVLGVAVCGRAGALRETAGVKLAAPAAGADKPLSFTAGILWCLASGVLSACANLGFDYSSRVADEAVALGAHPGLAKMASWMPVYWGGFAAVFIVCAQTMTRRGTWARYTGPGAGRDFLLTMGMGALLFLGQIPYGIGSYYLGALGTSAGWAICIACSLLVANGFGLITGEWRGAPGRARISLAIGVAVLMAAMGFLAWGNWITAG